MAEETENKVRRVPNDPTFVRHYADYGMSVQTERHFDILFMHDGPRLVQRDQGESYAYNVVPDQTVVAGVRIGLSGGVTLAMDMLNEISNLKFVKREEIANRLENIVERLRAEIQPKEDEVGDSQ